MTPAGAAAPPPWSGRDDALDELVLTDLLAELDPPADDIDGLVRQLVQDSIDRQRAG